MGTHRPVQASEISGSGLYLSCCKATERVQGSALSSTWWGSGVDVSPVWVYYLIWMEKQPSRFCDRKGRMQNFGD
jgi:hypothetical protein